MRKINAFESVRDIQKRVHIVGNTNNPDGGLTEWTEQYYCQREDYLYEIMEKYVGESEIAARGFTFLPYLLDERAVR